jgi:ABC-type uncharacterized transport system substrate-binding protein
LEKQERKKAKIKIQFDQWSSAIVVYEALKAKQSPLVLDSDFAG